MKRKTLTASILVAALAVMLVLLFRDYRTEQGGPSIQAGNVSSPGNQHSEKKDGLIVVENVDLSADELRELEELFEPVEDKRRMTEVVQLGQSVLADVLTYDDGRVAYTFLTPQSMMAESGEAMLIFKSETSMLHPDGSSDMLTAPTVITRENQSAQISISRADGTTYSMQFSGFLIGDDALALSAEMTGDPAMYQPRR
jgi:hypothetical protein